MALNSATKLPHAGTHEHTHTHKTSWKKELNKRTLGLGGVVPLPSSCSQHVRGSQRSYTSGQAPLKRSTFPSLRPSDEGTLDFLKKWQQLDEIPSTPLDRIHRSLTSQQCEEYLQSLRCDYTESHPAFARLSVQRERDPLRHAETWTRRFRPKCANEVLGNEHHATYLRDWLSALELHLRDRQPEEPVSKGGTARENKAKSSSKRDEPRGMKRPRVVRGVTKKRGNKKRRVDSDDALDDFVANEEETDVPSEDSEDELAFCQRTLTRLHRGDTADAHEATSNISATEINYTTTRLHEPARTNFADNLTNALLITGPPGCGKTAAVYACAEELGWEIFEVYPGIGKRNGANLNHLVGDVGRNHIVHRRGPTKTSKVEAKERKGLGGYLAKSKGTGYAKRHEAGADGPRGELKPLPPDEEMVLAEEAAISGMWEAESEGRRAIVGQSLVLLEEVDILFKEDAGFWPAVIEFIECCQRPVVMTCNDPGLVPLGDLALQKVLVFEPCPSAVAARFLQCVSVTEGCLVPHEDLMVLYESTQWRDGGEIRDGPFYPRTEPVGLPDLRRSITQLQMLCAGARHGSTSEMHQGEEAQGHVRRSARPISAECRVTAMESTVEKEWWRKMRSHSELMSHVDAQLCGTREVVSVGEEEMGYVVVSTGGWCGEGLVFYRRDELIAEEAIRHSRGLHASFATGPNEASINPAARLTGEDCCARVEYQSRMVEALQGILERPAAMMGQRGVYLDYIPWVGYMVRAEDEMDVGARGGRSTRNSRGTREGGLVVLSGVQRGMVRGSRL
ncbi:hypothetical protein J3R82DRAFT_4099 [Butyriboletus roseoflavus]|nr:hypothetical protein J3R82DRAFT_4099 [Butyriboletus roseoflavus]